MKTENFQERLFKAFPLLYRDVTKPMTVTCACWGIECGPGWNDIIWDLSEKLERCIQKMKQENPTVDPEHLPAMSQCKEKYGTLRFYMTTETDEMSKFIDQAEDKTNKTCEECGKEGQLNNDGGWMSVKCRDHWKSLKSYDDTAKAHAEWLKEQEEDDCN